MRTLLLMLMLAAVTAPVARAQVSIAIEAPGVGIGINLPDYPELVPVPGYPVYYAPRLSSNYFFYDGLYWVYEDDRWYASDWYNGPWWFVEPAFVPLFILRVPVGYYRRPPPYFRGWRWDAPPRWGRHWGHHWEAQHRGWDRWDHAAVPRPAPLPNYQRQYFGERYPRVEQQQALHGEHYRYQPREAQLRRQSPVPREERAPVQPQLQRLEAVPQVQRAPRPRDGDSRALPRQAPVAAPRAPMPVQVRPAAEARPSLERRETPRAAERAPYPHGEPRQGRAERERPRGQERSLHAAPSPQTQAPQRAQERTPDRGRDRARRD